MPDTFETPSCENSAVFLYKFPSSFLYFMHASEYYLLHENTDQFGLFFSLQYKANNPT